MSRCGNTDTTRSTQLARQLWNEWSPTSTSVLCGKAGVCPLQQPHRHSGYSVPCPNCVAYFKGHASRNLQQWQPFDRDFVSQCRSYVELNEVSCTLISTGRCLATSWDMAFSSPQYMWANSLLITWKWQLCIENISIIWPSFVPLLVIFSLLVFPLF